MMLFETRILRAILFLGILLPCYSYAQFDLKNSDQYFWLGRDMVNVNTLEKVEDAFGGVSTSHVISEDKTMFAYAIGSGIIVYNSKGEQLHTINTKGDRLAPNLKYVLFYKEKDIYRSEVNWRTGSVSDPSRVTQLGIFYNNYKIFHWYENTLMFWYHDSWYILDTKTKDLTKLEKDFRHKEITYSPDGRFLVVNDLMIYDFKEKKNISIPFSYHFFTDTPSWINDSTFIVINSYPDAEIRRPINTSIITVNCSTGDYTNLPFKVRGNYYAKPKESSKLDKTWVSPKGKYILYFKAVKRDDSDGRYYQTIWLTDVKTGVNINTEIALGFNLAPEHFVKQFLLAWTTEGSFVYSRKGDLSTQGLWFYDIHKKESRKVTNFLPTSFLTFVGHPYFVFQANNDKVYRSHIDGSQVEDIPEYFDIRSKNFKRAF